MNIDKRVLHLAVAAVLGGSTALRVEAAGTVFSAELPSGSQVAAAAFAIPTSPYAPTTYNPLYLQFSLTNGASWLATPSVACSAFSGGGGGAVATASVLLAAGGLGTAYVTFLVTAVSAAAQITSCTITNGNLQLDDWPLTVNENAIITYGNAITQTGITSTALVAASSFLSNSITAGVNTADVVSAFVSFATTTNTATMTYVARIGKIYLKANDNLLATGSPANTNGLITYMSAITVSAAGTPLAAGANSLVFITSGGGGTSATCTGAVKASQQGTANITFTAFTAPNSDTATYALCLSVTGGTPIAAGTITVGITGVPNLDQVHPYYLPFQVGALVSPGTVVGRITRNGASTTVLALPRAGDQGGDQGFLRIYNTSLSSGAVTANVYVDGSSDGSSALLAMNCPLTASLAGKSALIMNMAQLEAAIVACGAQIPVVGRYRLEINGVFPTMRTQAYVRNGSVLSNVSPDSPIEGN